MGHGLGFMDYPAQWDLTDIMIISVPFVQISPEVTSVDLLFMIGSPKACFIADVSYTYVIVMLMLLYLWTIPYSKVSTMNIQTP
jgi:hypothetical protein